MRRPRWQCERAPVGRGPAFRAIDVKLDATAGYGVVELVVRASSITYTTSALEQPAALP
jgi:hypothetical protein